MNIELIQSTAKTMLEAHAPLSTVTVLADDGSGFQTPVREEKLGTDGILVLIWQPTGATNSAESVSKRRHCLLVDMPITVEENQLINLDTGLGIDPDLVVREIISCLAGKPSNDPYELSDEAYSNLGDVDGINLRVINFQNKSYI